MQNDTISDMLTRIRNANILQQKMVLIPWTKINEQIISLFQKEGFLEAVEKNDEGNLVVSLKYDKKTKKPCITNLQRVSKPGLRLYSNAKDIPQVLGGMGVLIISTSKGLLTDRQAKQNKVGGELLCSIW
uniref:ribosomal protein S8 n=1 Tax=Tetraselmis marina TaxID=41888 RepID=UPI0021AB9E6E|nr:ribosomal protein S8 [Tetraselmis marina]UUA64532.1 ribosomal protein S8 [Tetraselmis marina]